GGGGVGCWSAARLGLRMGFPRRDGRRALLRYCGNCWIRTARPARRLDDLAIPQLVENPLGRGLGRHPDRRQPDLRHFRWLVGRVETGKMLKPSGSCFGVETFGISSHAFLERSIDEDLQKSGGNR